MSTTRAATTQPADMLQYLLQSDDRAGNWTLGGTDIREEKDPESSGTVIVLNKWSSSGNYEIYKITPDEIQIRYEVFRPGGSSGKENWIRRFEEIGAKNPHPGATWCKRRMIRGGEGFLSRFRQDKFIFDEAAHAYVIDKSGSNAEMQTYNSIIQVKNDWRQNNRTGFELNPAIRLISEWQTLGLIFESYDYARGKGLIAWRYYELISNLKPYNNDTTGKIFACESGAVYIEDKGDAAHAPKVFKYDTKTSAKAEPLEVISFTSHWKPELGPQWYVIFRNSIRENPLEKKAERIAHDFTLPEWTAKPHATIKDLPRLFTRE
jgi:hypothetical protein